MPDTSLGGVLIVEDESELRSLLAMVLEEEDLTVFQARDGQGAAETLRERSADIAMIITDLGLPRLGGFELIALARALNPDIRIIGTSGMSGGKIREMTMAAGAEAFLAKPFSVKDMLDTVRRVLNRP